MKGESVMRSRSYIAIPPGATIKEQLEDRGMSQKEFALRMGMSEKHISHLINGDVQLTPDVAYKIEMVLGLPARFWNNLEAIYREKIARVEAENALDEDTAISKKLPYKEMARYGWVPNVSSVAEKVINLRKFFEVAQLGNLLNTDFISSIACRRLSVTEKTDYALLAWTQRAQIEARGIDVSPINIDKLIKQIPKIRDMTIKDPSIFCHELIDVFATCGIAVVFLPHIGGSFLHGASFYNNRKIVMGLTLRGKDADKFWFSLFHEMGHIILGHLNSEFGINEEAERKADDFARDNLISPGDFNTFVRKKMFSKESILEFAKSIGIDPGIVVGRLQKEGYIEFSWHNDLKTKYELST